MDPLPHEYALTVARDGASRIVDGSPRPTLVGGPPPQFGGREEWWSPEHLLLASVGMCFLTTLEALAAREKLAILGYRDRITGRVDKSPVGLRFSSILHAVDLRVAPEDIERARAMLVKAKKHCLVANSLAVPVELEARVEA
jgi:organic hydroperoxide reductase OsmC/OhrA